MLDIGVDLFPDSDADICCLLLLIGLVLYLSLHLWLHCLLLDRYLFSNQLLHLYLQQVSPLLEGKKYGAINGLIIRDGFLSDSELEIRNRYSQRLFSVHSKKWWWMKTFWLCDRNSNLSVWLYPYYKVMICRAPIAGIWLSQHRLQWRSLVIYSNYGGYYNFREDFVVAYVGRIGRAW